MTTYYDKLQLKLSEMQTDNMIPQKPSGYEELEEDHPAKLSYDNAMVAYAEALEELKAKVYAEEEAGRGVSSEPAEESSE